MFNVSRLELARKRRRYTGKTLAELAGISPVTLSRIVNGLQTADERSIEGLVRALQFPHDFFFKDDIDPISANGASFRSLTAMSAKERDAALAAGLLAFELSDWVNDRFNLPNADIIDLSHERDPAGAARTMRQYWGIGERPIGHMVKLLETKGVRIFSLAENTKNVDAFSCWRNGEPFIFSILSKLPREADLMQPMSWVIWSCTSMADLSKGGRQNLRLSCLLAAS